MKGLTVPFYFYRCGMRERSKGIIETRFVGKKVVCFIKPTGITGKKNAFRQSLFSGMKQKKQKQKVGKISSLFLPFN